MLGTHAEELERLQFQNQLWRPIAKGAWQRTDLGVGERVLDVGCGPDVNRRLPGLLTQRGWSIEALHPLPVLGGPDSMAGQWMERFVAVYGQRLQQLGLWSDSDAAEAAAEIADSHTRAGCFWVGPTLLELRARRS